MIWKENIFKTRQMFYGFDFILYFNQGIYEWFMMKSEWMSNEQQI